MARVDGAPHGGYNSQVYEGLVELKGTRPDLSAIDMAEMLSATALKELMIKEGLKSDFND